MHDRRFTKGLRFPDIPYFRDVQVQADLTAVLYLHSATHPNIGYRQGMHELLASIFLAIDYDSVDHWSTAIQDKNILEMCDRTWVAADAWSLFEVIMRAVNPWYEWQDPTPSGSKESEGSVQPYVTPIVTVCNRIQNQYLSKVDPTLWRKLSEVGIEPQLYGM